MNKHISTNKISLKHGLSLSANPILSTLANGNYVIQKPKLGHVADKY